MSGILTFHQSVIEHYLCSSICQLKSNYGAYSAQLFRMEVPDSLRKLWALPESISEMSVGCMSVLKKLTPLLDGNDEEREVRRELASICCPSIEPSWDSFMLGDLEVSMTIDEVLCWIGQALDDPRGGEADVDQNWRDFACYIVDKNGSRGCSLQLTRLPDVRNFLISTVGAVGYPGIVGYHNPRSFIQSVINAAMPLLFKGSFSEGEAYVGACHQWMILEVGQNFIGDVLSADQADGFYAEIKRIVHGRLSEIGYHAERGDDDQGLLDIVNELLEPVALNAYLSIRPELMSVSRAFGSLYYLVLAHKRYGDSPCIRNLVRQFQYGNEPAFIEIDQTAKRLIDLFESLKSVQAILPRYPMEVNAETDAYERLMRLSGRLKRADETLSPEEHLLLLDAKNKMDQYVGTRSSGDYDMVEGFFDDFGKRAGARGQAQLMLLLPNEMLSMSDEFIEQRYDADGLMVVSQYIYIRIILHALSHHYSTWTERFNKIFEICLIDIEPDDHYFALGKEFEPTSDTTTQKSMLNKASLIQLLRGLKRRPKEPVSNTPCIQLLAMRPTYWFTEQQDTVEALAPHDGALSLIDEYLHREDIQKMMVTCEACFRILDAINKIPGGAGLNHKLLGERQWLFPLASSDKFYLVLNSIKKIDAGPDVIIKLLCQEALLLNVPGAPGLVKIFDSIKEFDFALALVSDLLSMDVVLDKIVDSKGLALIFDCIKLMPGAPGLIADLLRRADVRVKLVGGYAFERVCQSIHDIEGGQALIHELLNSEDVPLKIGSCHQLISIIDCIKGIEAGAALINQLLLVATTSAVVRETIKNARELVKVFKSIVGLNERLMIINGLLHTDEVLAIINCSHDFVCVAKAIDNTILVYDLLHVLVKKDKIGNAHHYSVVFDFIKHIEAGPESIRGLLDPTYEGNVLAKILNGWDLACIINSIKDMTDGPAFIFNFLEQPYMRVKIRDAKHLAWVIESIQGLEGGPAYIHKLLFTDAILLALVNYSELFYVINAIKEMNDGPEMIQGLLSAEVLLDKVTGAWEIAGILSGIKDIDGGLVLINQLLHNEKVLAKIVGGRGLAYIFDSIKDIRGGIFLITELLNRPDQLGKIRNVKELVSVINVIKTIAGGAGLIARLLSRNALLEKISNVTELVDVLGCIKHIDSVLIHELLYGKGQLAKITNGEEFALLLASIQSAKGGAELVAKLLGKKNLLSKILNVAELGMVFDSIKEMEGGLESIYGLLHRGEVLENIDSDSLVAYLACHPDIKRLCADIKDMALHVAECQKRAVRAILFYPSAPSVGEGAELKADP